MTEQIDDERKRAEAAELAAIQRNTVTVPADKLAELQVKAAQRDELLEAVTLILLDVDGNEWEDSDISDNDWDVRINNGKKLARKAIAKAKEE